MISVVIYIALSIAWGYYSGMKRWPLWKNILPILVVGIIRLVLIHNHILNW